MKKPFFTQTIIFFSGFCLLLSVANCASRTPPDSVKKQDANQGKVYLADRYKMVSQEISEWYTSNGITPDKLQSQATLLENKIEEFFNQENSNSEPEANLDEIVLLEKFRFFYGMNHPAETEFMDKYMEMLNYRYFLQQYYLSGEPVSLPDGGQTVLTWAGLVNTLEVVLPNYTNELREILGEEFEIGFGRLGEADDLFTILRLDAKIPLKPDEEKAYYIHPYDLIPQTVWVEYTLLTPQTRERLEKWEIAEGE